MAAVLEAAVKASEIVALQSETLENMGTADRESLRAALLEGLGLVGQKADPSGSSPNGGEGPNRQAFS